MLTKDVFDILEDRRAVLDDEDEIFGMTPVAKTLAEVRETAAEAARDAVGTLDETSPEATHDEIVDAIEPLVVEAKRKLDAIPVPPTPPTATPADKLRMEIVTLKEMQALVPLDDPNDGGGSGSGPSTRPGDTVLYTDPHGASPVPAIVASIHGDGVVNLATLNADGTLAQAVAVPYSSKAGSKGRWTCRPK